MSFAKFTTTGRVSKVIDKQLESGYFNVEIAVTKSYQKDGEWQETKDFLFFKVLGKKVPKTFTIGNLVHVEGEIWQRIIKDENGYDVKVPGFTVTSYVFLAKSRSSEKSADSSEE
jgi:single-stranded DNA-binding protein